MDANEQFFYNEAGWSYNPDRETPEQGRRDCARALAEAERLANEAGVEVRWETEQYPEWGDGPEQDYQQYMACLYLDGECIASLGCVDLGATTAPEQEPYARVVAAELALEVKDDLRRAANPASPQSR